jgi:3-phosphoshikimate 1-carboxyvinyltransferase
MERSVDPSFIEGEIKSPSSKSMTQRAIAAAMLAEGQSLIINPSYCDDSLAAMSIAVGLGAKVEPQESQMLITGCREAKERKLNCGESGLAIRMFSPIAALFPDEIVMNGSGSLKNRPMNMIGDALVQLGVGFGSNGGFLPLTIRGPIRGGRCEIDGSVSSQLLTGLLMALPLTAEDSQVVVSDLKSKPYVDMTINVLNDFGINVTNEDYKLFSIKGRQTYKSRTFEVEGDWSGGAFLIVAGAINGDIVVRGLHSGSCQSDKAILEALGKAEARIRISEDRIEVTRSAMKAFEVDATDSPDLFPPLAALAAYCEGTSRIKGASRLLHKESNRADALISEFGKMGIKIRVEEDLMSITGGRVTGAAVSSHNDHRIAMAAAVAALGASGPVHIKDSHCVAKSYPLFYEDLRKAGAVVHE